MPWREPRYEGEFPSLGWTALDWIADHLVIPDGDRAGGPLEATIDQARFTVKLLRLNPRTGSYHYRLGQMVWPKGKGKSPWAAALAWFFAKGPAVPAGWDSRGEPVGRPHPSPWIQIAANAEDQTENTWRALLPMASPGEGASLTRAHPDIDLGETRIFVNGGNGKLETVTSRAGTREGQRITFAVEDETEYWTRYNGGVKLDQTIRRNVAKMGGLVLDTCNAWHPGIDSVAEAHHTASLEVDDILSDFPRATTPVPDTSKKRTLKKALREVYGDAPYVPLDRIVAEFQDPSIDVSESRRNYLNDPNASASDQYFDIAAWDSCRRRRKVKKGEPITLGFDGSKFNDATTIVGCTADGHLFTLGWWEKPSEWNDRRDGQWEVPGLEVDATIDRIFETYTVVLMHADPPYWQDYLDRWRERHGDTVRDWWTNRPRQMHYALERLRDAIRTGDDVSHTGDLRLRRHLANSLKDRSRGGTYLLIRKEHEHSPKHIDGAVAATLAYDARGRAIASGLMTKRRRSVAAF